jgi:hypothetical protein
MKSTLLKPTWRGPARTRGYNLGNFMRTLAMPKTAEPWSLTSLREKLIKIGANVVHHGRHVTFQMAEVAVPRPMFVDILSLIARLRAPKCGRQRLQRCALISPNQRASSFRCYQPRASTALCSH